MTELAGGRPAELVLTARVARLYYLENRSKVDIAEQLGVSRFRVARLLEHARTSGMVHIDISVPGILDAALSAELAVAFNLRHAFVLDIPDDEPLTLRRRLGEAAGEALSDLASAQDVLGIAWARSLASCAGAITRLPGCPVVQLTGALSETSGDDLLELIRRISRAGGGPAHVFYAPMLAADARSAAAIRRQPDVAAASALVARVTIALVGIGSWAPGLSTIYDALAEPERQALVRRGVHCDVSGLLLDAQGRALETPLAGRLIVADPVSFMQIPTVLGVAYDVAKTSAVYGALRGGIVNGLVTHTSLARSLLAARDADPLEAAPRPRRSTRGRP